MRLGGYLESRTLGTMKRRLGRWWWDTRATAETSVDGSSWWVLTDIGFRQPLSRGRRDSRGVETSQ
jgi:hypothetical protein